MNPGAELANCTSLTQKDVHIYYWSIFFFKYLVNPIFLLTRHLCVCVSYENGPPNSKCQFYSAMRISYRKNQSTAAGDNNVFDNDYLKILETKYEDSEVGIGLQNNYAVPTFCLIDGLRKTFFRIRTLFSKVRRFVVNLFFTTTKPTSEGRLLEEG